MGRCHCEVVGFIPSTGRTVLRMCPQNYDTSGVPFPAAVHEDGSIHQNQIIILHSRSVAWPECLFLKTFFFKLLSPACVSACMLITGFLSRHRIIDLTSVPAVLSQLSLPALQNGTSARLCFCPATAAHCPLWGHWTLWSLTHKHLIFIIRFTSIWLSFNFSWTPWTQVSARVHSCSSSLAFLFSLFLQYM